MNTILALGARATLAAVVLFTAFNPDGGVLFQGPLAALGVGLIGLGLCLKLRQTQAAIPLAAHD